ncbi:MAG: SHOCT domain-containing protein [Candidatus Hodarchaeota archaeon]
MSDVSSGLIKLAYRGIAGFFVLLLMFIFGVVGIALGFAGGLVTALSWLPLAYPEILTEFPIIVVGEQSVTEPAIAFLALLITGLILLAVGFLLLAITYMIGKGAVIVDKELASIVDSAFSGSGKDRIARLERLAALRDRGVLTEKEFEREKESILESHE